MDLMDAINQTRLRVWAQQPAEFFDEAVLDVDGTLVGTDAECKQGIDIAYNGTWGYHPLLVSLANTAEPLYLVNRSGNRPSHEQADGYLDKVIALCRQAGFRTILLRGDTDFTQTKHLDRWDDAGDIRFVFGIDAMPNLKALADGLPAEAYSFLERPPRYEIKTAPRQRPERVKPEIVRERGFKTIHLLEEMVAEFDYRPVACKTGYRVIVLRKRLGIDKGQLRLFEEYRYFFYITNDREMTAEEIVFSANDRCDQENLIAQLKGGVHALTTPVDNLVSNWAYMVMAFDEHLERLQQLRRPLELRELHGPAGRADRLRPPGARALPRGRLRRLAQPRRGVSAAVVRAAGAVQLRPRGRLARRPDRGPPGATTSRRPNGACSRGWSARASRTTSYSDMQLDDGTLDLDAYRVLIISAPPGVLDAASSTSAPATGWTSAAAASCISAATASTARSVLSDADDDGHEDPPRHGRRRPRPVVARRPEALARLAVPPDGRVGGAPARRGHDRDRDHDRRAVPGRRREPLGLRGDRPARTATCSGRRASTSACPAARRATRPTR